MNEMTLQRAMEIFSENGIQARLNGENKIIISHYAQPNGKTFKQMGIDENELIKDVVGCEGVFDARKSSLTSFPLVVCKEIRLYEDNKIEEMPNLKVAGIIVANKYLKKMPKLKAVGSMSLEESSIKALPKLKEAGILIAQNSPLKDLSSLETVLKLCVVDCPLEDIKELKTAQDIFICSSDVNNLTPIRTLNIEEVDKLFVANTQLKQLPKIKKASKIALYNCEIKNVKHSVCSDIEIGKEISDSSLSDKFDTFTDWYNSDVLQKSMDLLGDLVNRIQS